MGFASVTDADEFNDAFMAKFKEQTIAATVKAEASLRRFELLHIAIAGGEVALSAVKDVENGLTVNAAEIGQASSDHWVDSRWVFSSLADNLAEDIFVRNTLTSGERRAGTI